MSAPKIQITAAQLAMFINLFDDTAPISSTNPVLDSTTSGASHSAVDSESGPVADSTLVPVPSAPTTSPLIPIVVDGTTPRPTNLVAKFGPPGHRGPMPGVVMPTNVARPKPHPTTTSQSKGDETMDVVNKVFTDNVSSIHVKRKQPHVDSDGESEVDLVPSKSKSIQFLDDERCEYCIRMNLSICRVDSKGYDKLEVWANKVATTQHKSRRPVSSSCFACSTRKNKFCHLPLTKEILGKAYGHGDAGRPPSNFPIETSRKRARVTSPEPVASTSAKLVLKGKGKETTSIPSSNEAVVSRLDRISGQITDLNQTLAKVCELLETLIAQKDDEEE